MTGGVMNLNSFQYKLEEVVVKEIARAGDRYLFKFNCPSCEEECLCGSDNVYCVTCEWEAVFFAFDVENVFKRNIVAMTDSRRKRGRITKKVVNYLKQKCLDECVYCGVWLYGQEFHIDHIIPLSAGGTSNLSNLALSCPECNLKASSTVCRNIEHKRAYILKKRKLSYVGSLSSLENFYS